MKRFGVVLVNFSSSVFPRSPNRRQIDGGEVWRHVPAALRRDAEGDFGLSLCMDLMTRKVKATTKEAE